METLKKSEYSLDEVQEAAQNLNVKQLFFLSNFLADICGWDTTPDNQEGLLTPDEILPTITHCLNELGFPEFCIPVRNGTQVFKIVGKPVNKTINKMVKIQNNTFIVKDTPTTQEDIHFGIKNRFDLFQEFEGTEKLAGRLVEYLSGEFSVLHDPCIRYNFPKSQILFLTN